MTSLQKAELAWHQAIEARHAEMSARFDRNPDDWTPPADVDWQKLTPSQKSIVADIVETYATKAQALDNLCLRLDIDHSAPDVAGRLQVAIDKLIGRTVRTAIDTMRAPLSELPGALRNPPVASLAGGQRSSEEWLSPPPGRFEVVKANLSYLGSWIRDTYAASPDEENVTQKFLGGNETTNHLKVCWAVWLLNEGIRPSQDLWEERKKIDDVVFS